MIGRLRNTGFNRAAGTGSDTDALQTDVMRFMSILGLCLMAVFALVQSLPLHDAESVEKDRERARLQEKITAQQQRAQGLEVELQRLLWLVEQANAEMAEKERALSDAEQQLTAVVDRTEQVRAEQRRVSSELRHLQQRLAHGRNALTLLQQATNDKAQSLRTLQQRLSEEIRKLDEIRQKVREVKLQHAEDERRQATRARKQKLEEERRRQAALRREEERREQEHREREQQMRAAASPVIEEQITKAAKKGFTLRFASDEALQEQVANGGVSLFAMVDKQAWRLSLPKGRPVFTDAVFPGWFHEMAASTVPHTYVKQLQSFIAPKAHGSIVWGVQLPPATKQDIASLTRGRQGGDLVIASNGRVSLTGE